MTVELLILDMSRYGLDEVNTFFASWSELIDKNYKLCRPRFAGETLRTILPEHASAEHLFDMSSAEQVLPLIVFRPDLDILNIHAWKAFEQRLRNHTCGVRLVSLQRDIFSKGTVLYPEGMTLLNTTLL